MAKTKRFFTKSKGKPGSIKIKSAEKVEKIEPIKHSLGNKSVNSRGLMASRIFWLWVGIGLGTILLAYYSMQVMWTFQKWQSLHAQRERLGSKIQLWEEIIGQYPSYRDAYFEAAILAYQLGQTGKVQDLLQKLSLVDQNFPYAKKLLMLTKLQTIH